MLPRPPSLQSDIDFISAVDDALASPGPDATPDAAAEFERKLGVARETGDYSAVLLPGKTPSKFVLRNIPSAVVRKLADKSQGGSMGPLELLGLVFRIAVRDIVGLKVGHENHGIYGQMVRAAVLEDVRADIVNEVGLYAWQRAQAIAPKP